MFNKVICNFHFSVQEFLKVSRPHLPLATSTWEFDPHLMLHSPTGNPHLTKPRRFLLFLLGWEVCWLFAFVFNEKWMLDFAKRFLKNLLRWSYGFSFFSLFILWVTLIFLLNLPYIPGSTPSGHMLSFSYIALCSLLKLSKLVINLLRIFVSLLMEDVVV